MFEFGSWPLNGRLARLLWAIVHIYLPIEYLLIGFETRILVAVQWLWRYLTYSRGARLMTKPGVGSRRNLMCLPAGAKGRTISMDIVSR